MSGKNVFVFVVCGADEHITRLNFSIKQLKRFSKNRIVVVTDMSRNSLIIDHNDVIDITTPAGYDHHQASIYLKTSLHEIFDLSDNYCYLDSDVISVNSKVDEIFDHQYGPVTFAADHCKINSFSPNALNCGCLEKNKRDQKAFIETIQQIIPGYEHDNIFENEKGRELYRILDKIKANPFKIFQLTFNYLLAKYLLKQKKNISNWGGGIKYSSRKKGWIDLEGNMVMHNLTSISKKIKATSEFSLYKKERYWINKNGEKILDVECDHLIEKIQQKFNINIDRKDFQHWNGGVFLFNKNSKDFLETWHQFTMDIFNDINWKTRDQGTLAATVWYFGLQNQKRLPTEFNFIADYYNPSITYQEAKGFTINNFRTIIKPNFIHVYHEFGNKDWDIWKGIEMTLNNSIRDQSILKKGVVPFISSANSFCK